MFPPPFLFSLAPLPPPPVSVGLLTGHECIAARGQPCHRDATCAAPCVLHSSFFCFLFQLFFCRSFPVFFCCCCCGVAAAAIDAVEANAASSFSTLTPSPPFSAPPPRLLITSSLCSFVEAVYFVMETTPFCLSHRRYLRNNAQTPRQGHVKYCRQDAPSNARPSFEQNNKTPAPPETKTQIYTSCWLSLALLAL